MFEVVPCWMLVVAQTSARSFGTWAALGEHIGRERRFVDSCLSFGNQVVVIEGGRTYIPCLSFEDTYRAHFALASGHRKKVDHSMTASLLDICQNRRWQATSPSLRCQTEWKE